MRVCTHRPMRYACCAVVGVTTERELADALQDKERFIRLDAHIGLTGAFRSAQVGAAPCCRSCCRVAGL